MGIQKFLVVSHRIKLLLDKFAIRNKYYFKKTIVVRLVVPTVLIVKLSYSKFKANFQNIPVF